MRGICLVCLLAVGVLGVPAAAQEEPSPKVGPPDVVVQLRPQAGTAPRKIVIGPRGVGVCKATADCPNHFTVTWVGARNEGERIRVLFDDTEAAGWCLSPVDFYISAPGPQNRVAVVAQNSGDCDGKQAFFFTVSCEGGEGGNCGGVAPVDPGAMIDG